MWPNPQETADLVLFTEEIPNGKSPFLCSVNTSEDGITNLRLKSPVLKND